MQVEKLFNYLWMSPSHKVIEQVAQKDYEKDELI